jgi:hypothetical protein
MSQKKIIISVIVSLAAGIILSVALQNYKKNKENQKDAREAITENPFYEEFRSVGTRNGLNMEFTRHASCYKTTQLKIEDVPLLGYAPKSCDILLVGDSTMAWGMIPEVIEQMTGLKVGVFSSEALILNMTIARLIDNLASYYLKDDGLLIISFGSWTQEQNAQSMVLVYIDWICNVANMNNTEFAAYMEKWKKEQTERGSFNLTRMLGFPGYRESIGSLKLSIAYKYGLSLLQLQLYNDYIEPYLNPTWHNKKMEMKAKVHCTMRWNNRSIIMYSADLGKRSVHSESPPDPSYKNKDIEIVSGILKKIPGRKAYQIHITIDDSKYTRLRSIYNTYYKGSFGLIDLGREHPKDATYEVDEKEHTINTGGFYQSILIGKFLKKNFRTLGKQ